jgi:hypothetical protein
MTTIVFSKDRALQLDAFLRSYARHVTPREPVEVLYRSSSDAHAAAYLEVFDRHPFAFPHPEWEFKSDLLALLPLAGRVIFFVDDQVFTRGWRRREDLGLSLRLGTHLTQNYASNDPVQLLPTLRRVDEELLTWRWMDGDLAWSYPLSVDGHVFDADVIRTAAGWLAFHSPNTFESALQALLPVFLQGYGLCYDEARVVNVPWTRVQTDWENRYQGHCTDSLLRAWQEGQQIDLSVIDGVLNDSVHQDFQLTLEAR